MTNTTTYRNPWHKPGCPEFGPKYYSTDRAPRKYRGYLIYNRIPRVWDVVKNGVCVTQRVGLDSAMQAIDAILE